MKIIKFVTELSMGGQQMGHMAALVASHLLVGIHIADCFVYKIILSILFFSLVLLNWKQAMFNQHVDESEINSSTSH